MAIGDYFQLSRMESLYRSLVTADLPARHLIVVTAYPDAASERWMADGQPPHGLSFDAWREVFLRVRREHAWKAARVISTIDGVVVQIAINGNYTSTVLSGRDPTKFSVAGANYELLNVELRNELRGEPAFLGTVRSDTMPTLEGVRLLSETIRAKLPTDRLDINVRPDEWFVYGDYPVWFPFCIQRPPPTWEDFRRAKQVYCDSIFSPMHCADDPTPTSPDQGD